MSEQENEPLEPFEEPEQQPEEQPDTQPDTPQEEQAEQEEQPEEQPSAPVDEERSKMFQKIERSFSTYKAAVERNLGDEVTDWLGCPLCYSGTAPGYVNRHDLGHVPEEVKANVQMFLGYAREKEYPEAKGINQCAGCAGLGKVSTGSRVAEHMTITCPDCKGYGYTPPPGARELHSVAVGNGQHEAADPHADLEVPDRDNWGEPRILPDGTLNDNYGKQPQFKTRHPVYGETRLLSPEELVSG